MATSRAIVALLACCLGAAAQQRDDAAARRLFTDLNAARSEAGQKPLRWSNPLADAAALHTERQAEANELSHQLPGEPALGQRLGQSGARIAAAAENVGLSSQDADDLHAGFMHSPGHRANIVSPDYDAVGISAYRANGILYATEDFAKEVPAISPADADLRVRDAIAATRGSHRLPPLQLVVVNGAAPSGCSAPDPLSRALTPGHTRSVVTFTANDPGALPAILLGKLASPQWKSFSLNACEQRTPEGFTDFNIRVTLQD